MSATLTLVRATQTCYSCPSQWDAWDVAGNKYYLRYRFGHGMVVQYETPDAEWPDRPPMIEFSHGDSLDGTMSLDDFARLAGITLLRLAS